MKRLIDVVVAAGLLAGVAAHAEDVAEFGTLRVGHIELGGVKTNAWPAGGGDWEDPTNTCLPLAGGTVTGSITLVTPGWVVTNGYAGNLIGTAWYYAYGWATDGGTLGAWTENGNARTWTRDRANGLARSAKMMNDQMQSPMLVGHTYRLTVDVNVSSPGPGNGIVQAGCMYGFPAAPWTQTAISKGNNHLQIDMTAGDGLNDPVLEISVAWPAFDETEDVTVEFSNFDLRDLTPDTTHGPDSTAVLRAVQDDTNVLEHVAQCFAWGDHGTNGYLTGEADTNALAALGVHTGAVGNVHLFTGADIAAAGGLTNCTVVSGGKFALTWTGPTCTVFAVSLDGVHTNKIGDFYSGE